MVRVSRLILWAALAIVAGCQSEAPASSSTPNASATPEVARVTSAPAVAAGITATVASSGEASANPTATIVTPMPTATASSTTTATHTPTPTSTPTVPAAVVDVEGATLPPGFSMIRFANLFRPTSLTFDQEGRLFATSQDGAIHVFSDEDGDGRADSDVVFSSGFNIPLGVAISPDGETVYVSSNSRISTLRDPDRDLVPDEIANLVRGLPFGRHQNNNLKFGPDGMLYMGVGSTCDACNEPDARSATLMRFDPTTGEGEVYATGLRNSYDLAFHPFTGDLFATDNGRDDLGPDAPGEELNLIFHGADYGWPGCWDVQQGPECEGTETAVAFFESHASANSMEFYVGDRFPAEYASTAETATLYVAVYGSWLKPEAVTGIARVRLTPSGESYTSDVSWFAQWPGAMPLGLAIGSDGALYVGDYPNDRIYRISYGN